jgi:hypothetical protein
VRGFWSLTLYNQYHFFAPNEIKRYSVGTKNTTLRKNPDGSLTIYVQAAAPMDPLQRANWLPAPQNADFSLFMRSYWPKTEIIDGSWTPPAVVIHNARPCSPPTVANCRKSEPSENQSNSLGCQTIQAF